MVRNAREAEGMPKGKALATTPTLTPPGLDALLRASLGSFFYNYMKKSNKKD